MSSTPAQVIAAAHSPELDGLRGLAIAMVLLFHYGHGFWVVEPGSVLAYALVPLRIMWAGVDLFFVLSGFLICGILIRERHDPHSFRVFYGRRAMRILPLYALLMGLFFAGIAAQGAALIDWPMLFGRTEGAAWHLVFGQNFHQAFGVGQIHFLSVSWSLAVEEQMYLLLPLLVHLCRSHLRVLAAMFVLMLVCAALLRAWIEASVSADDAERWCYVLPFTRWDAFAMGGLLALGLHMGKLRQDWRWRIAAWLALSIGLAGMAVVAHGAHLGQQRFVPIVLAFGGLLCLALVLHERHLLRRMLRLRLLRWLGKVSYGIYLWHIPVLGLLLVWSGLPSQDLISEKPRWLTLLALMLTLVLSWASYRWLESPLLRWGRRRWQYGRPPVGAAA